MSTEPLHLRIVALLQPGEVTTAQALLERLGDPALTEQGISVALDIAQKEGLVGLHGVWGMRRLWRRLDAPHPTYEPGLIAAWFLGEQR